MKPIVYASRITVRFSDLDPYGHVNSAHYLDYVISARFVYARDNLNVTERLLKEKGVGFFLSAAQSKFVAPVVGVQELLVSSWVERIDGARLYVPYEIKLPNERVANHGELQFTVIDLSKNRPVDADDWVRSLFFSESP